MDANDSRAQFKNSTYNIDYFSPPMHGSDRSWKANAYPRNAQDQPQSEVFDSRQNQKHPEPLAHFQQNSSKNLLPLRPG